MADNRSIILLSNIKKNLSELEEMMEFIESDNQIENFIYRYYHCSFKMYGIQLLTKDIVHFLNRIFRADASCILQNIHVPVAPLLGTPLWCAAYNGKKYQFCVKK